MRHLSLFFLVLLIFCGCKQKEQMRYVSGSVWGTTYHIKYASEVDLNDSIVAQMRGIDMSLSPFNKGSLVSKINGGERVKADSMFTEVLALSKYVNLISGGLFDPTVSPLINLWGFGYREGAEDMPTQTQIDSALVSVGVYDCSIDRDGYVLRKSPMTEFNFSAVAKGYGVDRIAQMLRRNGCTDYMVEVGGEMALSGDGPSGDGWRIQVDAPVVEDGEVQHNALQTIHLTDRCIATSGNYRNHRTTSEGMVGHTISPLTGWPVMSTTLSATIIAPNTALADALATAAMAMNADEAIVMLDNVDDVQYIIVVADGQDYQIISNFD